VTIVGEFALKKGESVENEKVGITLVDVKPGSWFADRGSFSGKARAAFRFYTVADNKTICEYDFTTGGYVLDGSRSCKGLGFTVISIQAINTRDDWALFRLSGSGNH
jgi:hypothetical protein